MKRFSTLGMFLSLGIVFGCSQTVEEPAEPVDPNQADMETLQGTWVLESGVANGKPYDGDKFGTVTLVVSGKTYAITGGTDVGTSGSGTFRVDAAKSPKEVDLTAGDGPDAGKVYLGIYSIEGDVQKTCFAPPGADRPAEFESPPGSKLLLQQWKRAANPSN